MSTDINTTRDALKWAYSQAEHNTATEQQILAYLASNAFLSSDNPEDGIVGQVMYYHGSINNIMECTGIRSRNTVRRVLNSLQYNGFIYRKARKGIGEPPVTLVLWGDAEEMIRQDVREGVTERPAAWSNFLRATPQRGLRLVGGTGQ